MNGVTAADETQANGLVREYLAMAGYSAVAQAFEQECQLKGAAVAAPAALPVSPAVRTLLRAALGPDADSQSDHSDNVRRVQAAFTRHLRDGNDTAFLGLWEALFPPGARRANAAFGQIDFQVHVYLAVFPLLAARARNESVDSVTVRQQLSQSLDSFKRFLETRGAEMCKAPQFLAYYALPYVPDPTTHPSFRELFTETWSRELEERVAAFVDAEMSSPGVPSLVRILNLARDADGIAETSAPSVPVQQIHEMESKLSTLMERHRSLQGDYHKLVTIASELVQALTASLHGEHITPTHLTSIVQRLAAFRRGLANAKAASPVQSVPAASSRPPAPSTKPSPPISHVAPRVEPAVELHVETRPAIAPPPPTQVMPPAAPVDWQQHLNYAAIRRKLESGAAAERIILLHALRTHITATPLVKQQRRTVAHYVAHDLLLRNTGAAALDAEVLRGRAVPNIAPGSAEARLLREQLAKLLNTMASNVSGRSYLLGQGDPGLVVIGTSSADASNGTTAMEGLSAAGGQLIAEMVALMKAEPGDTVLRQQLIGTLQKLSLRRAAQSAMNAQSLVEWLVELLHGHLHGNAASAVEPELSEFTLEYAMALFMNLCLRADGKTQCEAQAPRVMRMLTDYLENDNFQVRMYVNGSLYSLLTRRALRQQADAVGLEDMLGYLKAQSDESTLRQIDFVLHRLHDTQDGTGEAADVDDAASDDGQEDDFEDEDVEGDEMLLDQDELNDLRTLHQAMHPDAPAARVILGEDLLQQLYLQPTAGAVQKHVFVASGTGSDSGAVGGAPLPDALRRLSRPQTPSYARPQSRRTRPPTADARGVPGYPAAAQNLYNALGVDSTGVVQSQIVKPRPPRQQTLENIKGQRMKSEERAEADSPPIVSDRDVQEYYDAFSTRPKVPRTPLATSTR